MLRVEHLRIGSLPPLSFEVADGECLAVEGPSGTGKTRLLRTLADLDPVDGQIFLDGAERAEMRPAAWRKLMRFAAAEPAWWTDTPRPAFPPDDPGRPRLARLLASLGLAEELLDRPISQLSTGERQRLALARALIDEPRVLLLDEPSAALDPASAALVEEVIRYQLLSRRSVLLVSHDPAQIGRLAHARLLLAPPQAENGRAVAESGRAVSGNGAAR